MTLAPDTPLTDTQRQQWRDDGYCAPFQALAPARAAALAAGFHATFKAGDPRVTNRHVDLPAIASLCAEADVWGRLAGLLGPDLVLWRSNLFLGKPSLQWHQDQHAALLQGGFGVSALLALTDGNADNCTLLAPGSHRLSVAEKEQRYGISADPKAGGNVRFNGALDANDFIRMPLRAGECLVFHPQLLHASSGVLDAGSATGARVNLVLRVTTPEAGVSPEAYAPSRGWCALPVLMRGRDPDPGHAYTALP